MMTDYTAFLETRKAKAAQGGKPYRVESEYKTVIVLAHNKAEAVRVARLPRITAVTRL